MKILRYHMEDWLNDSFTVDYNLSASGCQDYTLAELLALCGADIAELGGLFLGDNDTRGSLALRQEICRSYDTLDVDRVLVANGSSEALFCFFNELLEPGDEVVIPFPAFQCLYQIPISIGCRVKFLNLLDAPGWRLDLDRLESLVTPATKLIINNPHNPVGWSLTSADLVAIGEIARKNDAHLLFDEHYRYLPLTPGADLIPSGYDLCRGFHPKTHASGSMIKCLGIVGIRIGWLLSEPGLLARCRDYKDYLTHTIPLITDHVAQLALMHREAIVLRKKLDILANLAALNAFMAGQAEFFEYHPPAGGVVSFPALRQAADSRRFCEIMLRDYRVSLLPGFAFEAPRHLRLNIGIDRMRFAAALTRMDACLAAVKAGRLGLEA
ncbi:MAG: aminotransferase class I/II-fold pyridoxal phosphate-dependent enzyme [Pseudomonadota bacterium]